MMEYYGIMGENNVPSKKTNPNKLHDKKFY